MKIIFTCGGTAGHISPALALARLFQSRRPDTQILFVGAAGESMESRLVPKEGFPLERVEVSSFYRKLNWEGLRHNAKALADVARSRAQADRILDDFQPDLVVGTGGYASYPVTRQAARRGIPTAIHESNAVPGLTTRRLAKYVDRVMLGLPGDLSHYPHPERVVVTGTPVRPDFFAHTRQEARAELGFSDDKPLVLASWGSLGAEVMNRQMVDFLALCIRAGCPFRVIHGSGERYFDDVLEGLERQDIHLSAHPELEVRPYLYDMPLVMAAADLVLCRAGASTLSELSALGKPAVLIPSPNVTGDHQTKNAQAAAEKGGAVLLPEARCTPQGLFDTVTALLADPPRRREMGAAIAALAPADAHERIYQTLMDLL